MLRRYFTLSAALLALISCSTTKVLEEGEYRLRENIIEMEPGKDAPTATSLHPYLIQKANNYTIGHWNPGLYIYNWENGKGKAWDRIVHGMGTVPVIFDSTAVGRTILGMENHMDYMGYFNSTVTADVKYDKRLATVTYHVNPGKLYDIDRIDYVIPDPDMNRIITENSDQLTLKTGNILSSESLEKESDIMTALLRNNGYYKMSKNFFFYYADTTDAGGARGSADLTVRLRDYTLNETEKMARPHRRYTFGEITVTKPEGCRIRDKFLDGLNRIHKGDVYSDEVVNSSYSRISSIPLFNTVNLKLTESERDSNQVDCNIILTKSKLQSIKLDLAGSFNSTGLFGITPGITYSHKNVFHGGEVLSVGFLGNFQFKFNDKNTRATEYGITASLQIPRFMLLSSRLFKNFVPRTDFALSYNYQSRQEYTRDILSASYGYMWSKKNKYFFNVFPVKLNSVKIYDIDSEFYKKLKDPYLINAYQDHLDFGAEGTFYYTTDASINPDKTYFYTKIVGTASGNILSIFNGAMPTNELGEHKFCGVPYSQYVRLEASAVQTIRFGKNNRLSVAGRLLAGYGYAYGNSSIMPFEKLFYSGGAYGLRGWRAKAVGPGAAKADGTFSIPNQTGDMKLEANIEFRFPIIWKLAGGVFTDAGNVWNLDLGDGSRDPASVFKFNNFLCTSALDWGIGLRLDLSILLVRIDWGMQLYNPAEQAWCKPGHWFNENGAFHFGIGYPF